MRAWSQNEGALGAALSLRRRVADARQEAQRAVAEAGAEAARCRRLSGRLEAAEAGVRSLEGRVAEATLRAEEAENKAAQEERAASVFRTECASLRSLVDSYAKEVRALRAAAASRANPDASTAAAQAQAQAQAQAEDARVAALRAQLDAAAKEIGDTMAMAGAARGTDTELLRSARDRAEAAEEAKRRAEARLTAVERELARAEARLGAGSFDPTTTRVLHLTANPAKMAKDAIEGQKAARAAALEAEVAQLRAEVGRLRGATGGGDDPRSGRLTAATPGQHRALPPAGTAPRAVAGGVAATPITAALRGAGFGAADAELRARRLREQFTDMVSRYREAVYLLTGYKIRMTGEDPFMLELRSVFAEGEGDMLLFELTDGELRLIETPFARGLDGHLFTYLKKCNSVPAFLSNLTLYLFDQTTLQPGTDL